MLACDVWRACLHSHDFQEETLENKFKILLHGLIKVVSVMESDWDGSSY